MNCIARPFGGRDDPRRRRRGTYLATLSVDLRQVGDEIIFDIGEQDGRFLIAFHEAAVRYMIDVDVFMR